jgi:hypothetical protein
MQQAGKYHIGAFAGLTLFALVGLPDGDCGINRGWRRAVLAVVGDQLMLLQVGPLGRQRRQWQANQVRDIDPELGWLAKVLRGALRLAPAAQASSVNQE